MGMEQHFFSGVFFSIIVFIVIAFFLISKISSLIQLYQKLNKEIKNVNERIDSNSNQIIAISDNLLSAKDDKLNLIEFPKSLDEKLNKFMTIIKDASQQTYNTVTKDHTQSLADIKDLIAAFEQSAKSNKVELEKYKDGYDFIKNKSIVSEIISNLGSLKKYEEELKKSGSNDAAQYLSAAYEKLNIILQNNNIETFKINNGLSIDESDDCEIIETIPTSDSNLVNTIAETLEEGFKVVISDSEKKIIRKAKISVYVKEV